MLHSLLQALWHSLSNMIRLRRFYNGALTLDFHLNSAAWDANDNLSKWTAAVSESGDGDGGRAGIELADCYNSINVCYSDPTERKRMRKT